MTVKVNWYGDLAKERVAQGGRRAVGLAAAHLLKVSNKTIPEDAADRLEKSGKATVPAQLTGVVSYDTPYARRQHEDLEYRHKSGRRAKWLQRTLTEQTSALNDLIARVLREAL